jgi:hypothetical protein
MKASDDRKIWSEQLDSDVNVRTDFGKKCMHSTKKKNHVTLQPPNLGIICVEVRISFVEAAEALKGPKLIAELSPAPYTF